MNLTALRETYDDFLSMLLGRDGKIDFGREQMLPLLLLSCVLSRQVFHIRLVRFINVDPPAPRALVDVCDAFAALAVSRVWAI